MATWVVLLAALTLAGEAAAQFTWHPAAPKSILSNNGVIAGRVTEAVVDQLEAVEIHEQHGVGDVGAPAVGGKGAVPAGTPLISTASGRSVAASPWA